MEVLRFTLTPRPNSLDAQPLRGWDSEGTVVLRAQRGLQPRPKPKSTAQGNGDWRGHPGWRDDPEGESMEEGRSG